MTAKRAADSEAEAAAPAPAAVRAAAAAQAEIEIEGETGTVIETVTGTQGTSGRARDRGSEVEAGAEIEGRDATTSEIATGSERALRGRAAARPAGDLPTVRQRLRRRHPGMLPVSLFPLLTAMT
jgi:hypothetical protein